MSLVAWLYSLCPTVPLMTSHWNVLFLASVTTNDSVDHFIKCLETKIVSVRYYYTLWMAWCCDVTADLHAPHFPLNNFLHCWWKRTEQYLAVAFTPSSEQQTRAIFVDSYLLSTTLVDNQNWAEPSTFNIVDNFEQCGQRNIVQYCYTVSSTFLFCVI